jgi:hypothetical protein
MTIKLLKGLKTWDYIKDQDSFLNHKFITSNFESAASMGEFINDIPEYFRNEENRKYETIIYYDFPDSLLLERKISKKDYNIAWDILGWFQIVRTDYVVGNQNSITYGSKMKKETIEWFINKGFTVSFKKTKEDGIQTHISWEALPK